MSQSRSLRDRVAGQSAMSEVVRFQRDVAPRSPGARLFGISPLGVSIRPAYRDALGELLVGDILENLGQKWDVLHDLPLGEEILDHLVIGPAGVFAVQAANHGEVDITVDGNSMTVAGVATNDCVEAVATARRVESILTTVAGAAVAVTALVVIIDPKRLIVRSPPAGALVVSSRELAKVLDRASPTLTGGDVARVSDIADLVSTWPAADEATLDTQNLHREFGVIRVETRSALRRRLIWSIGLLGLACALTWVTVAMLVSELVS